MKQIPMCCILASHPTTKYIQLSIRHVFLRVKLKMHLRVSTREIFPTLLSKGAIA